MFGTSRLKPTAARSRLAALSQALGVGRLRPLLSAAGHHRTSVWRTAVHGLDSSAYRNGLKFGLLLITFLLGFAGFQQTVKPPDDPLSARVIWNNLFHALQLFTTQFPRELMSADLPWQLQVARFLMPIFAAWFTLAAVLRRFNRPLLAWLAGRAFNHVVLVGASDIHLALAKAYRRRRWPVVAIVPLVTSDVVLPIEEAGGRLVFGAPTDVRTLRRAGVHRAAVLIAADDVGPAAVELSSAVAAVNKALRADTSAPLPFLIRLAYRELRDLVATQALSSLRDSQVDLRLYVRERTIARALLARYPADWGLPPGPHDIHAVIVGFGEMGSELLMQLARIAVPSPGQRTIFTILDRDAEGLGQRMVGDHPGLEKCATLRFIPADLRPSAIKAADIEAWMLAPLPATAIYVCCGEDHANMAMVMGLRRAYAQTGTLSPPVFVDQHINSAQVHALAHMHGAGFDTLRVLPFGSIEEEADPFHLIDEEIDELARRLHESYLTGLKRPVGGGEEARVPAPAEAPWSELEETYRAANRSQADHILMKLRGLGLHAADEAAPTPCRIDGPDLEAAAMQEHERWCRDRWLSGWTYAETRDNVRLHHPNLRPYDELDEDTRDKDRQAVEGLPAVLAQLGMGLKREHRVGLWFDDARAAPSNGLVEAVVKHLTASLAAGTDRHLQLVFPLRSQGEMRVALTFAERHSVGIDVALMPSGNSTEIGRSLDPETVRRIIAVSDRAFHVVPSGSSKQDGARLAALCDVCETVVIACAKDDQAKALLSEIGEARRPIVKIVIPPSN